MEHTDNSSKNFGLIGSITFHGLLVLLLIIFALRLPDPPLGGLGDSGFMDINYGTAEAGYGDLQTLNQTNESDQNVESSPSDVVAANTNTQISNQENQNQSQDQSAVITGSEEVNYEVKEKNVKQSTDVSINKTDKNPNTQTNSTDKSKTNGTTGTQQTTGTNNNGDQKGKTGDQGDKNGTVDSKNLYQGSGGPGTGGIGNNLEIAGWNWDDKPVIKDNSDESGRIVIGFRIDENGDVVKVWKIENNMSPSVYKIYEDEVRKLTFSKKNDNINVAAFSEGKVTFIKKSK